MGETNGRRWAFTLSNAGSYFFEDRADLGCLDEIDWQAVQAGDWRRHKEGKQAEFLLEHSFPWQLVERIEVNLNRSTELSLNSLPRQGHRPVVEVHRNGIIKREESTIMIEYRSGDILKSGAEALVNTVNCVGVMGRGIALQFKNAFPDKFRCLRFGLQERRSPTGSDVRLRHWQTDPAQVHHQLSYQTPLAWQEPN